MPIIDISSVTKEYRLGQMTNLKESAVHFFNRLRGKAFPRVQKFKALDDITFKVESGEVVGIIGTNGAGKSTMLKILARVITPTKGKARVNGSVAPLIEVGAGLHPELTGRENIYLNGSILGISRQIIRKKFDEIVEFAELEEFINTPVKRYSSGMTVRLGFSIATAVDSDILIVDEVLAVGDLAFQRKCFDRMEDLIKRHGKTVLLVSHNIRQVERLCSRVILLDHGKVLGDGEPSEVCNLFYDRSNTKIKMEKNKESFAFNRIRSSGEVDIDSLEIYEGKTTVATDVINFHSPMCIGIEFTANLDLKYPEVIVGFHTTDFFYISTMTSASLYKRFEIPAGKHRVEFYIDDLSLTPGVYSIRVGFVDKFHRTMCYGENLKTFMVSGQKINVSKIDSWGVVDFPFNFNLVE